MVACPLGSERPMEDNDVGRRSRCNDLAGRGQADHEAAATREQLLGDQDGEWCADDASNDPDGFAGQREGVKLGVVAWPGIEAAGQSGLLEAPKNVAVRIQNAR